MRAGAARPPRGWRDRRRSTGCRSGRAPRRRRRYRVTPGSSMLLSSGLHERSPRKRDGRGTIEEAKRSCQHGRCRNMSSEYAHTSLPDGAVSADVETLARQILDGSTRALARGLTWIESGGARAAALGARLYPNPGRAEVVGLTGAPGSGKSTLARALALVARARGRTVGVLAVDPSSPFTGGAILGDRIRMSDLALDPGVFIRSMATR